MGGIFWFGKIWTFPFHLAQLREMEMPRFCLAILFLPFHSEPLNVCIFLYLFILPQELLSFKHPHIANPKLQRLENAESQCEQWFDQPYDEMIAAHLK